MIFCNWDLVSLLQRKLQVWISSNYLRGATWFQVAYFAFGKVCRWFIRRLELVRACINYKYLIKYIINIQLRMFTPVELAFFELLQAA